MATQHAAPLPNDSLVAAKQATFSGFVKLSTYGIVGVAVVLILMALFLL